MCPYTRSARALQGRRVGMLSATVAGAALLVSAQGCANAGEGFFTGGGLGAATGAVIGAFAGEAAAGTAIGAITGAVAGSVIGDQNERARQNAYIASQSRERVVYVPERRYEEPWDAERYREPAVRFDWRVYEREHHHHRHHHYERCYDTHPY